MILEKLENISRYHYRLEIQPRPKEVFVRVKSTKISRNKKMYFDYEDIDGVNKRFEDIKDQDKRRKERKKKKVEKRKKDLGFSTDYKKKAIDGFQNLRKYETALESSGTIHYGYCCTCKCMCGTNAKSKKEYGEMYPEMRQGHAGHGVSRGVKVTLLYGRNIAIQCSTCNRKQGSNFTQAYQDYILEKYGQEELDYLLEMKRTKPIHKIGQVEYKEIYEDSKAKLEKLGVVEHKGFYYPKEYVQ